MRSIRIRMLLLTMLVIVSMLVLASVLLLTLLREGLTRQLDQRLMTAALGLTQAFDTVGNGVHFEWEGVETGPKVMFCAWDRNGREVARSKDSFVWPLRQSEERNRVKPGTSSFAWDDGIRARMALVRFVPHPESEHEQEESTERDTVAELPSGQEVTLVVADTVAEVDAVLNLAKQRLRIVFVCTVAGSLLLLWPLTGMIVRPVRKIAAEIHSLDAAKLTSRIDVEGCPTELRPITSRLNEFMGRLDRVFQHERETTANIAHELRTPLAGLRATMDLAESRPRSDEFYRNSLSDCQKILAKLQATVDRILLLSRLDGGAVALSKESVNTEVLLREVWQEVSSLASNSIWTADWNIDPDVTVWSDSNCLRQIVRNLLENAIDHGDNSRPIVIVAGNQNGEFEISIGNQCDPIQETELPRLKERFYQHDSSRSRTGKNAGLGLAISDQLAQLLGGRLDLKLENPCQFRAILVLQ